MKLKIALLLFSSLFSISALADQDLSCKFLFRFDQSADNFYDSVSIQLLEIGSTANTFMIAPINKDNREVTQMVPCGTSQLPTQFMIQATVQKLAAPGSKVAPQIIACHQDDIVKFTHSQQTMIISFPVRFFCQAE